MLKFLHNEYMLFCLKSWKHNAFRKVGFLLLFHRSFKMDAGIKVSLSHLTFFGEEEKSHYTRHENVYGVVLTLLNSLVKT